MRKTIVTFKTINNEKGGCLLWLLGALIVIALVGGAALYFGARYATGWVVDEFASDTNLAFTKYNLEQSEVTALTDKIQQLSANSLADNSIGVIEITVPQINAMLSMWEPEEEIPFKLEDVLSFDIVEKTPRVRASFPLTELGYEGKFLNLTALLELSTEDGKVAARISQLRVNDKELPEAAREKIYQENILADNNGKHDDLFTNIDRVEVTDNSLVFHKRKAE